MIVDHELSPSQVRNLERATGAEVLDRTGVIVEIFHRHANSREARLQVEIARLNYVAPRLRESAGGGGRQQGPGAGESALELDRRKIRDRIAELKDQLAAIQRDSDHRRSAPARPAARRAGRLHQRRQVVADARADRQRGAGRRQALRHARHHGARAAARDAAAHPGLRHGRLHQEAAARPGRVVPLDARRGAGGLAAAVRGRRVRPDLRGAARGHPQRAARDRRRRRALAPAAQQGRPARRGRARRAGREAPRRDPALRARARRT